MAHIKRKYIDSHWLVFIFQGAVALLFGCITLFTANNYSGNLMPAVGTSLIALAIIEFSNCIYRTRRQQGFIVSLLVAFFDAVFGIALFWLANEPAVWHMAILAAYTLTRGIFEILIGFRTTIDPTDRFIWVLCGVCGAVFGVVILNSGHLPGIDFIRFFGAYMLILGVSSLIYGVHNHEQQREDREARSEAAQKAAKGRVISEPTPTAENSKIASKSLKIAKNAKKTAKTASKSTKKSAKTAQNALKSSKTAGSRKTLKTANEDENSDLLA